jgi:hypothetical protein
MKAFVASTLLKKLIGPYADLFFDSRVCLVSMVLVPWIMDLLISLRAHAALCFPQIARGADGGDR